MCNYMEVFNFENGILSVVVPIAPAVIPTAIDPDLMITKNEMYVRVLF